MWFPLITLTVLMTVLFAVALVAIVRRQLKWEDEQALTVPESVRETARTNYRILVGTIVGTYAIFLATAIYFYFLLRDMNPM